jgi:DNA-directed RNA polymerase specialized sigma24 family protein
MGDVPESWRAYARLQASISTRNRVDDQSWGLEAGLNHFLDIWATSALTSDRNANIERAITNGRARERYRIRLRTRFLADDKSVDPEPMLGDRERLKKLFVDLDDTERKIMSATALGYDSAEISASLSMKPATVRKRIDRLRFRLAA